MVVVSLMPELLHIDERLKAVNQNGILRDHVEQRTKPFELPRQRSIGRVTQDFSPADSMLRELRDLAMGP